MAYWIRLNRALPVEIKRGLRLIASPFFNWWARLGSNQRPLPCEGSALPLSYAPLFEEREF
jgi:hypothetical protein